MSQHACPCLGSKASNIHMACCQETGSLWVMSRRSSQFHTAALTVHRTALDAMAAFPLTCRDALNKQKLQVAQGQLEGTAQRVERFIWTRALSAGCICKGVAQTHCSWVESQHWNAEWLQVKWYKLIYLVKFPSKLEGKSARWDKPDEPDV